MNIELTMLFFKKHCKGMLLWLVLFAALYAFGNRKDYTPLLVVFILNYGREYYGFVRIEKLIRVTGQTAEQLADMSFLNNWQETRARGFKRYCLIEGGLIKGVFIAILIGFFSKIAGIMLYVHKKYGAEDEGYPPIVGAGGNGCILHYEENNATAVQNQLVLMDVGAEYHGYSADVTRTFPANGKFTEAQKAIYQIVYDAQEAVFALCKAGVPYSQLEIKTREVLSAGLIKLGLITTAAEVSKYYPHGVSHHIGLDVHDKGGYGGDLQEGMVITVEPGIYIPAGSPCDKKWWNIGVRIEDDIQITKDKGINLSADAPRKWQDIEKVAAEKSIFDAGKFPVLK